MTLLKVNGAPVKKTYSSFLDDWFNEWTSFGRDDEAIQWKTVPVNIHETKDAYHLELSSPGLKKEDLKINVENDVLTISYEQKEETKSEDYKTVRREFKQQSFRRSFTLNDKIDSGNIQGRYEDGILKLYIPKKAEAQAVSKKIEIQ
jgi:HSP20 family protein